VNTRQRVVVVIALGVLAAAGAQFTNLLLVSDDGGWFAYAPNTGAVFAPDGTGTIWREALTWIAATALWAGASLWLLRSRHPDD
jgi:hypothetical protein